MEFFKERIHRRKPEHLHQNNAPIPSSILVSNSLTEMGMEAIPHPHRSSDLAHCDLWLYPKIKEAVTKALNTYTLKGFHGAISKWLGHHSNIKRRYHMSSLQRSLQSRYFKLWAYLSDHSY